MSSSPTPAEQAFIEAIKEGIAFLNSQIGLYADACAGFSENSRVIKLQKARVQTAARSKEARAKAAAGLGMVYVSHSDPSQPDVIHHNIVRVKDFLIRNEKSGSNEQLICQAIISFIFAYWEEGLRYKLAKIAEIPKNEVASDVFGDLRILRHVILHDRSILSPSEFSKLKILKFFEAGEALNFDSSKMKRIFEAVDKEFARLLFERLGIDTSQGPGDISQIKSIAIQGFNRS